MGIISNLLKPAVNYESFIIFEISQDSFARLQSGAPPW